MGGMESVLKIMRGYPEKKGSIAIEWAAHVKDKRGENC